MRTVLAVVAIGAIAAACSSFGASESDVTEGSDASTNDASGETGSPSDASTDVSDGSLTGPFCTTPNSTTAFCASFDDGNPVSFDWDGIEVSSSRTRLEVVNGVVGIPSPPGALHAAVELLADTTCYARANLRKTLSVPTALSKVHAEFVTKVDAVNTRFSFARFMTQSATDTAGSWSIGLSHAEGLSDYSETYTPAAGQPISLGQGEAFSRYLQLGKWTKVAIDITFAPAHFDVSFDDVVVASHDSSVLKEKLPSQGMTLELGPITGLCPPNLDMSFDNVRISVE